jgi:hypothetical protein
MPGCQAHASVPGRDRENHVEASSFELQFEVLTTTLLLVFQYHGHAVKLQDSALVALEDGATM